jgi:hypothetical protein
MRLALIISGRICRYEVCMLPFLQNNTHYNIDLFISINDDDSDYYNIVRSELAQWLKGVYIKRYVFPDDFVHTHPYTPYYVMMDGKYKPLNQMSMYFNDMNAYNMAIKHSVNNNFEYDCIMKYRADMINTTMPDLSNINSNILYSIEPPCWFVTHGIYKKMCVSDAWCWGSPSIMKQYCDTYNYVLDTLKKQKGDYYIAFEDCITDNCYDKKMEIVFVKIHYSLDANRRAFDGKFGKKECKDLPNSSIFNVDTSQLKEHIGKPAIPQE